MIQTIYAVGLSLEDVPDLMVEEPAEASRRVERAIESLDQTIRDIRNFIFGLRPELLDGVELVEGLAALADEFRVNTHGRRGAARRRGGGRQPLGPERTARGPLGGPRGAQQHRAARPGDPGGGARRERRRAGSRSPSATTASVSIRTAPRGLGPPGPRQHGRPDGRHRRDVSASKAHAIAGRVSSSMFPVTPRSARQRTIRGVNRNGGTTSTMTEQPEPRPLRLLVVDDHEVVRQGLVALLDRREKFQVVAEAGTVAEAIDAARRFQPDLVIMDVRLPGRLRHRGLPRDPGRAARDARRDADQLPGRGGGPLGDHRRRLRATSSSRSAPATSSPPWRPSAAASRCSTRR